MSIVPFEIAKLVRNLSIETQREIQEGLKIDGMSLFSPYEISLKAGGKVCLVSGASLDDALLQIPEVAERFDLFPSELMAKEVSYMKNVGGKPAYEHVYEQSQMIPQVVYDFFHDE